MLAKHCGVNFVLLDSFDNIMNVNETHIYAIIVHVIMSDVISVRVRRELEEKAEELGINIRGVVEKALEDAIEKKEKEVRERPVREINRLGVMRRNGRSRKVNWR